MRTKEMNGRVSEGLVPVKSSELYYRSVGTGPPLLVVHGGPGLGHYYLRPGMDTLADRFRLIYYDQRGSGRSALADPDLVTIGGAIDDLAALIRGLGIGRAGLVGHSFGANLIALFAAQRPEMVASLVLANPGPPFDPEQQRLLGAEMQRRRTAEDLHDREQLSRSNGFAAKDPEVLEAYVRLTYAPFFRNRAAAQAVSYGFTQTTAENFSEANRRTFRDFAPVAAIASLDAIKCPTLVVHGELEPIPEAFSRDLANRITGAQYALISGANHFAYIEDPEPFFSVVGNFLIQATTS